MTRSLLWILNRKFSIDILVRCFLIGILVWNFQNLRNSPLDFKLWSSSSEIFERNFRNVTIRCAGCQVLRFIAKWEYRSDKQFCGINFETQNIRGVILKVLHSKCYIQLPCNFVLVHSIQYTLLSTWLLCSSHVNRVLYWNDVCLFLKPSALLL